MKHEILDRINIIDVISQTLTLIHKGKNHIGKCPFHEDKRASLIVNENRQHYKCFACGAGGDAIDFLMKIKHVDFKHAINILDGDDRLIIPDDKIQEFNDKRKKKQIEILPIADTEIKPTFHHAQLGMPTNIYPYRNINNQLIGYTCKFIHDDGSKDVLPYVFVKFQNENTGWTYAGFPSPRPMYGMEFLGAYPDATVVTVEGEKCADFGNSKIHNSEYRGKFVFVSWIGGAEAIQQTDFSIISDRNIIHWPDNDEPGRKAMKSIGKIVGGRYVHIPSDKPNKWDIADEDWSADSIISFIEENTQIEIQKPTAEKKTLQPIEIPQPLNTHDFVDPLGGIYFRVLGYSKSDKSQLTYWFYSYDHKMTVCFNASSLTKSNLMTIAPVQWWESKFPGGGNSKINMDASVQALINACNRKGIFNEDKIRGRGAWQDGDDVVLHVGDHLVINGEHKELFEYNSKFMYEINDTIEYGGKQPLETNESIKLLELIKWFAWDRKTTPYTFAGWLVIAPFCGVLDNRPHGWLTSTSGAGKTWIQENLIQAMVGDIAITMNSDTTSAGIRQSLQSDARPIIFDESEAETPKDRERLQDTLTMLRGASTKKGARIIKGTQSQHAKTFVIKTMAMLSSIGVYFTQRADKRRFTIFSLRNDASKRGEAFDEFKKQFFEIITEDYVKSLQQRTIKMLPTIIHNTKIFKEAISIEVSDRSTGDLLGGLIAGAYSLISDDIVDEKTAREWVRMNDWSLEKELKDQNDELLMFDELMSISVKIDPVNTFTIGEMIMIEYNSEIAQTELGGNFSLKRDINRQLSRIGIKQIGNKICIANNNMPLKRLMYQSAWVNSLESLFLRLPGAEKDNPRVYMTGQSSKRGVSIPIDILTDNIF